jgi:flavin-dependent dehydrogenase
VARWSGVVHAAIRLAREGFEVILIEREKFPRHKLCGEFISPECLAHFKNLGVLDEMFAVGGDRISETVFYSQTGKSVSVPSLWFGGGSQNALSISRAEMDFCLLEKAKSLGVRVLEETQVIGLLSESEKVCGITARLENRET